MLKGTINYNAKYKALEIYFFGCVNDCEGCCSPNFKDFNYGERLTYKQTRKAIRKYYTRIERIWITGGEPADIPHWELEARIYNIYADFHGKRKEQLEIWLWTSRSLTTIRPNTKQLFTHIKTGKYDKTKPPIYIPEYDITLSSNNQKITKME